MSISTRKKYNRWKLDKKLKEWGQYERYIDYKALNLANNNIEEIPSWIGGLKKIEILDLPNNKIKEIPSWIGKLKELKVLHLPDNNIEEIPSWIGGLKELKTLDLYENKIEEIPTETLKKCDSLHKVFLEKNPIPKKEIERARKELNVEIHYY